MSINGNLNCFIQKIYSLPVSLLFCFRDWIRKKQIITNHCWLQTSQSVFLPRNWSLNIPEQFREALGECWMNPLNFRTGWHSVAKHDTSLKQKLRKDKKLSIFTFDWRNCSIEIDASSGSNFLHPERTRKILPIAVFSIVIWKRAWPTHEWKP